MAPDVQYLLSRAMALQLEAGDSRVTVAHLEAALEEATGAGRSKAREPVTAPGPSGGIMKYTYLIHRCFPVDSLAG